MGKEEKGDKAGGERGDAPAATGFRGAPVRSNSLHASHYGPGSQWGKPYYRLGQECEKVRPGTGSPLNLDATLFAQTRINDRLKERTLSVFADLPSQRSQRVSLNKEGSSMDSRSHYVKIGSKHMSEVRPDHPHALHRSASLPHLHPYDHRRAQFKDPTPWHFNAAFSTTSNGIGIFYSSDKVADPLLRQRATMHWQPPATPGVAGTTPHRREAGASRQAGEAGSRQWTARGSM